MVASDNQLKTGVIQQASSFYAKALSEAERIDLAEAMRVTGLDEEIALLRLRLQQAIEDKPKDLELMFKGAALLARLVATEFHLSKGDAGDLEETILRAIGNLGEMDGSGRDQPAVEEGNV